MAPRTSKLVKMVMELEKECDLFRVELQPKEFWQYAQKCDVYNRITRAGMLELAQGLQHALPPIIYGLGNVNNGSSRYTVMVGNEGSRVIYVRVSIWGLDEDSKARKLDEQIRALSQVVYADEYSVSDSDPFVRTYRMWWD